MPRAYAAHLPIRCVALGLRAQCQTDTRFSGAAEWECPIYLVQLRVLRACDGEADPKVRRLPTAVVPV